MSSIDKAENGRWRARYRDPAGKSRSRTFRRKGDAERFLAATATDMHRGDWVDPKLRRARFDEWADAFEDGLVRLAPTTARRISSASSRGTRSSASTNSTHSVRTWSNA